MNKRKGSTKKTVKKGGQGAVVVAENAQTKVLREMLSVLYETNHIVPPRVADIEFPHLARNKVYTCTRQAVTSQITVTSLADANFAYAIHLNDFPDSADFTALFDQYRIGPVRIAFTPLPGAVAIPSVIVTAIDYDDSTAVARSALEEYDSCQVCQMSTSFFRTFQPRAALAAYGGSLFTSFANAGPSTWFDVASPGVPYYGLKGQIPASTFAGGPSAVWDVTFSAILQFRNTR